MKDMQGDEICEGHRVVYGKSSRNNPINIGTVTRIEGNKLYVLGDGNKKEGEVGHYSESRVLILPDYY